MNDDDRKLQATITMMLCMFAVVFWLLICRAVI